MNEGRRSELAGTYRNRREEQKKSKVNVVNQGISKNIKPGGCGEGASLNVQFSLQSGVALCFAPQSKTGRSNSAGLDRLER